MKISIIHPSRSRPTQAAATAKAWLSSAKDRGNVEYIISIDAQDPEWVAYLKCFFGANCEWLTVPEWGRQTLYNDTYIMLKDANLSAIEAINNAAKDATGDLLIVVSDDFSTPPFHWDAALLEALEGKEDFLVKTQDGCQPWIITLPIMDRKYYERFGYIYHPSYVHMYSDTEMTHVGELLGKVIRLDMVIKHNHYSQKNGQARDAINAKNDATYPQGEKLYKERFMRNFDLKDSDLVSKPYIHHSHMQWLKSKGLGYE